MKQGNKPTHDFPPKGGVPMFPVWELVIVMSFSPSNKDAGSMHIFSPSLLGALGSQVKREAAKTFGVMEQAIRVVFGAGGFPRRT